MRKTYMTPAMEINETEMNQMIALSIQYDAEGNPITADNSEVLTNEDEDWDIWSDEEE